MSQTNKKYDFTGKVALITGSSSGVGAAIAIQLAQYGAQLTITGRDAVKLKKVAQQIEHISDGVQPLQIIGDLRNDLSIARRLIDETIAKFGQLDILVNNAGGATPKGNLESVNLLEEFDQVFKLNVRSVVELTQLAVPHLEKTKGNVINISSIAALKPGKVVYSSSKAALDMVTKTSALELGPIGIRVNSINPGPLFETEFGRSVGMVEDPSAYDRFLKKNLPNTLLQRLPSAEDVANLASFLASDDALNITGSINACDGGFVLKF